MCDVDDGEPIAERRYVLDQNRFATDRRRFYIGGVRVAAQLRVPMRRARALLRLVRRPFHRDHGSDPIRWGLREFDYELSGHSALDAPRRSIIVRDFDPNGSVLAFIARGAVICPY